MYMDKIILNSEKHDLSGADILRITDNECKIFPYTALMGMNSLDEILEPFGACVLLYETKENYGHWVALIKRTSNLLEFYDPYGLNVDEELNIENEYHIRKMGGEIMPHLSALIKKDNYKVIYNKQQIQKIKEDVNTCGRYCALRIRLRDTTLEKFNNLLTTNKCYDADFWVSALTILI